MATRAETFKFEQEIHHDANKPAAAPKPRRKRPVHTQAHRYSDTGGHATYGLEISGNSRPSRKSTRGASRHLKNDSQLRSRQIRKATSAKTRAGNAPAHSK